MNYPVIIYFNFIFISGNGTKEKFPIDLSKVIIFDLLKIKFFYEDSPIVLINNRCIIQENIEIGNSTGFGFKTIN